MKGKLILALGSLYLLMGKFAGVMAAPGDEANAEQTIQVSEDAIGFEIPNFGEFLSFMIKFLFVLAGLLALFYMLWGALSWVTSGGDKDAVGKARDKIQAAVIGILVIVFTLSVIIALEQVVFKESICFGISCPVDLPDLLTPCKNEDGSDNPDAECNDGEGGTSMNVEPATRSDSNAKTADSQMNAVQVEKAVLPATGL